MHRKFSEALVPIRRMRLVRLLSAPCSSECRLQFPIRAWLPSNTSVVFVPHTLNNKLLLIASTLFFLPLRFTSLHSLTSTFSFSYSIFPYSIFPHLFSGRNSRVAHWSKCPSTRAGKSPSLSPPYNPSSSPQKPHPSPTKSPSMMPSAQTRIFLPLQHSASGLCVLLLGSGKRG